MGHLESDALVWIRARLDHQWRLATGLKERQIRLYEKRYREAHKHESLAGVPTVREILGRNERAAVPHFSSADRHFWCECVAGSAVNETCQTVADHLLVLDFPASIPH